MRVALVCPYDLHVPGGVQSHVRYLADELAATGDEVLVVGPGQQGASEEVETVGAVGATVGVRFNGSIAPITLSPLAARRALATLHRFRPDVTHVHEPGVPVVSLAVSLRAPRPLVATFHSWSTRDLAYRTARPLVRRAAARLDARIAVSRPALEYHARVLGLPAGSFREVPNGVDAQRFAAASPLPELVAEGQPTLLFVGRLERRKGVDELVRAFVQLKARRPEVRLLIVGDGPERERCQALLPPRLRPAVRFLGRVHNHELPPIFASADVFVAPSLGGESFGIVLLEAMAAGLPVVASALPGYVSLVRDGMHGRLVPAGDTRALADALDALLANPALRQAMGAQGRESARHYAWSAVAGLLRRAYMSAVEGLAPTSRP